MYKVIQVHSAINKKNGHRLQIYLIRNISSMLRIKKMDKKWIKNAETLENLKESNHVH